MTALDLSSYAPIPVEPFRYGSSDLRGYLVAVNRTIASSTTAQTLILGSLAQAQTVQLAETRREIVAATGALGEKLDWGFTLLSDRMEVQIARLEEISEILKRIENILIKWDDNRWQEAFHEGLKRRRQGNITKALEKFIEAAKKNDVDFRLQLQIGKLYLYGKTEEEDLIDLDAAEQRLIDAAIYARRARVDLGERTSPYIAESCYHLSVLEYLRASDHARQDRIREATEHLKRAVTHIERSPAILPMHRFHRARCCALLEWEQDVQEDLLMLVDEDRSFAFRALQEPDFSKLTQTIYWILEESWANPRPATLAAFEARDDALASLNTTRAVDPAGAVNLTLRSHEGVLCEAESSFEKGYISAAVYGAKCNAVHKQSCELRSSVLAARRICIIRALEDQRRKAAAARKILEELPPIIQAGFAAWFLGLMVAFLFSWLPFVGFLFEPYFLISGASFPIFIVLFRFFKANRTRALVAVRSADRRITSLREHLDQIEKQQHGLPAGKRMADVEKIYETWALPRLRGACEIA